MHIAALDAERLVVVPDCLGVGRVEQAVNLPVWIVEKLHLADAELVAFPIFCILRQLLDCFRRQFQFGVKIHEAWQLGLQGR
jgi:hypothetical protein